MPWFVNGQLVPEELIHREADRIARDAQWRAVQDSPEKSLQLRAASEHSAVDKVLIEQHAVRDPRPIDQGQLALEIERVRAGWGGDGAYDDAGMLAFVDRQLRNARANRELLEAAVAASPEEVENFYTTNRVHFLKPEMFRAAHIVKYVNRETSLEQARTGIEMALAELERGEAFAEVADRYSDCRDKGGDLGLFPAGYMVEEFETVLRALKLGQRSGVFSTPFGLHIAELRERIQPSTASLEDVRGEIERVLTFARRHQTYAQAVGKLRAVADIRFVESVRAAQM